MDVDIGEICIVLPGDGASNWVLDFWLLIRKWLLADFFLYMVQDNLLDGISKKWYYRRLWSQFTFEEKMCRFLQTFFIFAFKKLLTL